MLWLKRWAFVWGQVLALSLSCKTPSQNGGGSALQGVEIPSDDVLTLGPVSDNRLKALFYQAIEGTMVARDAQSDAKDVSTELGDVDSFRFTIMRLTKGDEDVTGDPRERPDGMDVEVTGWYKRTQPQGEGRRLAESCASFDTRILAVKVEGLWQLKGKIPLIIGREDPEDCY